MTGFHHVSVLLDECIEGLNIRPDGIYVDGTLGGAGHSSQIVSRLTSGMLVGIETAARVLGLPPVDFPQETAIGALGLYISGGSVGDFQPMNINFGIITPLDHRVKGKRNKNAAISARSLEIIDRLIEGEVFQVEDHH